MNKCEQYNDQATKHLFRLNNINYILNSLITSNLIDIVTIAEPDCRNSYIETIKELKFSYQKTWSKMLANISPLEELPKPIQGKVKDKDRSILKEKFLVSKYENLISNFKIITSVNKIKLDREFYL